MVSLCKKRLISTRPKRGHPFTSNNLYQSASFFHAKLSDSVKKHTSDDRFRVFVPSLMIHLSI